MELAERDPKDFICRESTTGSAVGPGLYQHDTAFTKPEIIRKPFKRHSVSNMMHQTQTAHSLYSQSLLNTSTENLNQIPFNSNSKRKDITAQNDSGFISHNPAPSRYA